MYQAIKYGTADFLASIFMNSFHCSPAIKMLIHAHKIGKGFLWMPHKGKNWFKKNHLYKGVCDHIPLDLDIYISLLSPKPAHVLVSCKMGIRHI